MPKKFGPAGDYRPLKVGTLKVKYLLIAGGNSRRENERRKIIKDSIKLHTYKTRSMVWEEKEEEEENEEERRGIG